MKPAPDPRSHAERLRRLAEDWELYDTLGQPEIREEMHCAVVLELRVLMDQMAQSCGME